MQSSNILGEFKFIDVIKFLKKPVYIESNRYEIVSNIKYVAWSYLFSFLGVIIVTLAILFIDNLIVSYFETTSIYSQFKESTRDIKNAFGGHKFLVIAIIGPLVEEIVFRLPLNARRYSVALAIATLVFRLSGNSFTHFYFDKSYLVGLAYCSLIFILINRYLPSSWLENIKEKHFGFWFYAVVVVFGLVHISNINNINYKLIYIISYIYYAAADNRCLHWECTSAERVLLGISLTCLNKFNFHFIILIKP